MMKKNALRILLPCFLTVAFLAAGIWMLVMCSNKKAYYSNAVSDARLALQVLDTSAADSLEQELAARLEENQAMRDAILALQEENDALDANTALLQQEYDQLAQQEDIAYYLTILKSLTEGMNQVEQYINGAE